MSESATLTVPSAVSLTLTAEQAADPKIRVKLLQIERRRIELAIAAERGESASQEGNLRSIADQRPRPLWGPCTRCGYSWRGYHSQYPPLHCARCCSRYWQQMPTHGDRARRPEDPPHPNWKPRKQSTRPARPERLTRPAAPLPQSSLPSPPRAPQAPLRPLADYLAKSRAAEEELQPERTASARTRFVPAPEPPPAPPEEPPYEEEPPDDPADSPVVPDVARSPVVATQDSPPPEPGLEGTDQGLAVEAGALDGMTGDDVIELGSNITEEERELLDRLDDGERS